MKMRVGTVWFSRPDIHSGVEFSISSTLLRTSLVFVYDFLLFQFWILVTSDVREYDKRSIVTLSV